MSTGKILIGVLAGVAVGATLGVLFAPDKGSNTRKKLSKSGEDLMSDMKAKIAGAKDEVEDMVEKGMSKAEEAKKNVKNALS